MPLKAGRNISGRSDLNEFYANEEGQYVEHIKLINKRKGRLLGEAGGRSHI